MTHLDLTLSDLHIIAERQGNLTCPWSGCLIDIFRERITKIAWTDAELAAVLALAINSDEASEHGLSQATIDQLYDIAEPLCKGLHKNLRPIP